MIQLGNSEWRARPLPLEAGGSAAARGVLWLRRSGARESCEPAGALSGRRRGVSPLASLTYDDLAVGMRAWEGRLLFFRFGCLGERTSGLEVWSRESHCGQGGVTDEGQRSGHRAGSCPSGSSGENDFIISVPVILCLK